MAEPIRWVNQSQPQTLYIVTLLLYLDAALGLIFGSVYFVFGVAAGILCLAAAAASGWGIANERQWGYLLGLVVSSLGAFSIGPYSYPGPPFPVPSGSPHWRT